MVEGEEGGEEGEVQEDLAGRFVGGRGGGGGRERGGRETFGGGGEERLGVASGGGAGFAVGGLIAIKLTRRRLRSLEGF